ncbi:MAG: chitinase [Micromonosporaceae bacterium]
MSGLRPGRPFPVIGLVAALALSLLTAVSLLTPQRAFAALGDVPLITYNMQGQSTGMDSKWTTTIATYANQAEIVMLQEAGANPPTDAPGTQRQTLSGNQLANGGAGLPPGRGGQVIQSQWRNGYATQEVYFLQTDRAGGLWQGGRVNLAIVTQRPADAVVALPNPLWSAGTNERPRATLGVLFSGVWYFNLHALSGGGGDAPGLLNSISSFVTGRGLNETWVALGDFNRAPATMQTLPAGARIYNSGQPTQQSGGELDYAVNASAVGGVMVSRLPGASSDHYAVGVGSMRAAAEPTPLFNTPHQAIESMQAGGVLDANGQGTANFTLIDSYVRNGQSNQSWTVEAYNDHSVRFLGTGSGRCIDITNSNQNPGAGTSLSLYDCSDQSSQRWMPQYLGDNEYQLHSLLLPSLCMNIRGGQTDPSAAVDLILYGCQNTPNERFAFTPADPSPNASQWPVDLSQYVYGPTSLENVSDGAIMDVRGNATADNSPVVSYFRIGGLNQGWNLNWVDSQTVSFQGVGSARCLDIHNSTAVSPGQDLVIFDCATQQSQQWRVTQLSNATEQMVNVAYPSLCMDVSGGNNTNLVVNTCSSAASQQWLFTSFDPTGAPTPDQDWDHDPSDLLVLPPNPGQPAQRIAYYPSWSIYANAFYPKNLDTQGIAGKLTTLNYAFENIDPVNLTCFAANQAASTDPNTTTGNDGSSDAWADYQTGYTSSNSVDGSTDAYAQPLKGNFNQLKELKAKYPNLKIQVSLGGWTYSKFFSDVAASDASRKKFVSSCIDMYIKGNLPVLDGSPAGGQGVAAGIFSGFDIDWEFPASANGHPGNHYGPQDTANYTLLLAEFRNELNALGAGYTLTAALPSGPSDINNIEVASVSQYLDFGDVMSYDMHGAWETTGPTNFQAPLYDSSSSPAAGSGLTVNDAINHYLMSGFPSDKLIMGVPLYGRGWTGVPDNGAHGLYQTATGPTDAYSYSQQPGVAMYKELESAGKLANVYFDPNSQSSWVYDGTNLWSTETAQSLAYKRQYIKDKGLAGVMMYSLEADDPSSTLVNAATGS